MAIPSGFGSSHWGWTWIHCSHSTDRSGPPLARGSRCPRQDVVLCFVGRFAAIKRLDLLLDAVAAARSDGVHVHLALVGDGEARPELEARVERLGLAGAVSFLGYRRDLPLVYAAADAAVLSSDNEGTPVSLIEAAAAGLPAVATDVGGVASVVTPRSGLLVAPGDSRALGAAIAAIASQAVKREEMGRAAREHVRAHFSAERLVDDVDSLYRELLA